MQIRSPPFWLMIVSMASVDFPVERSPMISSRWPRPIGIIASIALVPVWTGTLRALRVTNVRATRCTPLAARAAPLPPPPPRAPPCLAQAGPAHRLLFQVEREAHGAALELHQL